MLDIQRAAGTSHYVSSRSQSAQKHLSRGSVLACTQQHNALWRECGTQRRIHARKSVTIRADASRGGDDKALVVVGSVNADMVLQVERLPKEGETLAASNLSTFPGGKVMSQTLMHAAVPSIFFQGGSCCRPLSPGNNLLIWVLPCFNGKNQE